MKKFFPAWIICFVLAFVFNPMNVLASSENKSNTNVDSVSFADDDILSRIDAGETHFEMSTVCSTSDPEINAELSLQIWVEPAENCTRAAQATKTINWALSGRYYFKSTDETVSNYGNHGSVDYTGSKLLNEDWEVYHDVTYKYSEKYTATATSSEEDLSDGKKFIGKYKLKNSKTNVYCSDAEIYIIVRTDGDWETKGNYNAINID